MGILLAITVERRKSSQGIGRPASEKSKRAVRYRRMYIASRLPRGTGTNPRIDKQENMPTNNAAMPLIFCKASYIEELVYPFSRAMSARNLHSRRERPKDESAILTRKILGALTLSVVRTYEAEDKASERHLRRWVGARIKVVTCRTKLIFLSRSRRGEKVGRALLAYSLAKVECRRQRRRRNKLFSSRPKLD